VARLRRRVPLKIARSVEDGTTTIMATARLAGQRRGEMAGGKAERGDRSASSVRGTWAHDFGPHRDCTVARRGASRSARSDIVAA